MPRTQPGAASTTANPEGPYLGHVKQALRSKRQSEILLKKWRQLKFSELSEAIWSGSYELGLVAELAFREAVGNGTLLFCWEGTRALEVRK